jgi:hypothetical protein
MKPKNVDTGSGESSDLAGMERAAIRNVVVRSFTVTPDAVETGGAVTVAWKVTVPDSNDIIELKLNGQLITSFGQKSFSNLTQTTDFVLSASTENEETVLRKLRVRVDVPDCRWGPSLPVNGFVITSTLELEFNNRFSTSSQFSLRGNGTVVTLDDGAINIAVPVTIHVENWFNADMDVAIKLSVTGGGGSPVLVLSRGVSLEVSWSFFENLASLGCTHFVESGMSQLGQALMSDIVKSELVPKVAQAFNDQVKKFIAEVEAGDPQQRTYVLAFFSLSPGGLRFKVCPK